MDRNLLNDCQLLDEDFDPNSEFGVGECLSMQEDASPSVLPVPQFLLGPSDLDETEDVNLPTHPRSPNPWDPRLMVDLALAIDPLEAILERFSLTQDHYERLLRIPAFRRDLAMTMRELREDGIPFAKKAAVQAESYLLDVDEMVQDRSIAASTRLDAIKWTAKMGKLEPREEKGGDVNQGVSVNLSINFT